MDNRDYKAMNNEPMAYDTLLGTVIYLVQLCSGQYEDYTQNEVFATTDKERAEKWCDKFNKIIEDNEDRIDKYYDDDDCDDYDKEHPFWYDIMMYDCPTARFVKVELR